MKRDPALKSLSGEHHGALVLARALRRDTPVRLRASVPLEPAARIAHVQRSFTDELEPHFRVEERELLPLAECGDSSLRAHAAQLREEHAELRARCAALDPGDLEVSCDALGALLDAHVRFEERTLFPAIEAALDATALEALGRRAVAEPASPITGYHQDADGIWVAELDCGHRRHVRHQPPFQLAEWVTTERGRAGCIGEVMPCTLCRMPRLPPCAEDYKSTPVFDAGSVPAGLLRTHSTRAGTWGRIVVQAGRVQYVLEDEGGLTFTLSPGVDGIVAPQRPHHVEPSPDAIFQVHFAHCAGRLLQ